METNEYLKYMEINNMPYTIDTSPNQATIGKIKILDEINYKTSVSLIEN